MDKNKIALLVSLLIPAVAIASSPTEERIRRELESRPKAGDFQSLFNKWEKEHGSKAIAPLLNVASDPTTLDFDRYVAVMGAARLGGPASAPLLSPLLKDRAWMVRSAALKALAALGNKDASSAVLPLLRDPALVVRLDAVDAITKLAPPGSVEALIATLTDPGNYNKDKALWVPGRALESIRKLGLGDSAGLLRAALPRIRDTRVAAYAKQVLGR